MSKITVNDAEIAYTDSGSGLPLVWIHGHPFNRSMWQPQLDAFRDKFRVIAPDLRGFGESTSTEHPTSFAIYAQDVVAFLSLLGIESFILGGLSMGGQIALDLYRQFPERVQGLILADTFAQLDTAEKKQWRYDLASQIESEGMARYAQEVLPKMVSQSTLEAKPDIASHVLQMMRTTPPQGAADALRVRAERSDYVPLLPNIKIPSLIVVGSNDEFTPLADAELMHHGINISTLRVISDAGHMPNLEQPEAFNNTVSDFLTSFTAQK